MRGAGNRRRPRTALLVWSALLLCAACASPHRAVAHRSPAAGRSAPSGSAVPAASRPPLCRAGQLVASLGEHGPAAGTEGLVILLHNASGTPCWLSGVPTLAGVDQAGHVRRLDFRPATDPA